MVTVLSIVFETVLERFGATDLFRKPETPTFFIVYAHDNPSIGTADAAVVKQLITGLKALTTKVISDRSLVPEAWYTREEGDAVRDVLSNQFCLLPKDGKLRDEGIISSVDKVILCCSEVLGNYYKDGLMKTFIRAIKEFYFHPETDRKNPKQIQNGIEEIVKKYYERDGFHHVVTELAFLEIRSIQQKRDHGIIPVVLNGDGIKSIPFLDDGVPLWLKPQQPSESVVHECQNQHRLIFKLLRQMYTNQHASIDEFEMCYKRCAEMIFTGSVLPTQPKLENFLSTELKITVDQLIEHRTAALRTG